MNQLVKARLLLRNETLEESKRVVWRVFELGLMVFFLSEGSA